MTTQTAQTTTTAALKEHVMERTCRPQTKQLLLQEVNDTEVTSMLTTQHPAHTPCGQLCCLYVPHVAFWFHPLPCPFAAPLFITQERRDRVTARTRAAAAGTAPGRYTEAAEGAQR